jgi:hypothetical protein
LAVNVLAVTMSCPENGSKSIAPPACAMLFENVVVSMEADAVVLIAPPSGPEFELKLELLTSNVAVRPAWIAPPPNMLVFPENVEPETVRGALGSSTAPPPPLRLVSSPLESVSRSSVTAPEPPSSSSRNTGVSAAEDRVIVAPLPSIVNACEITGSPSGPLAVVVSALVSVYVQPLARLSVSPEPAELIALIRAGVEHGTEVVVADAAGASAIAAATTPSETS